MSDKLKRLQDIYKVLTLKEEKMVGRGKSRVKITKYKYNTKKDAELREKVKLQIEALSKEDSGSGEADNT